MYLTREEEAMLEGERGEAIQKAMELLVAIGEALGAERLIPIESAHVSGVSVLNIGAEGVELIEWFASRGAKVQVPTTVNPMGFDADGLLPRSEAEWRLQLRLLRALAGLGANVLLSCTPYEQGNRPRRGAHIAWAESSAVIYANSVLGARSNREGGIVALAAAITGRVYLWGLHLDEERQPQVEVRVDERKPLNDIEAGLLGAYIGLEVDAIPLLKTRFESHEAMKNMLAAAAAWGSHALIHIEGVTPEAAHCEKCERIEVDIEALHALHEREFANLEDAEAVFIGCPHPSKETIERLASILDGCKPRLPVYLATPARIRSHLKTVKVLRGTCLVVYDVKRLGFRVIATNSLKAAFYLKRRHGVEVAVAPLEELVKQACG